MKLYKKKYWETGELVTIGVFAALIKISTILVAVAGGGMNPITLVLKNVIATSLLIILIHKVKKFGVLTLFTIITSIVSFLLLGNNMAFFPGAIFFSFVCDAIIHYFGKGEKTFVIILVVGIFDFSSRFVSLCYSWFLFKETIELFIVGATIVAVGYLGCLIGLITGSIFAKELKHAGIIKA